MQRLTDNNAYSVSAKIRALHEKALAATARFKTAESELIDLIGQMDQKRGYLEFEVTSIYGYATKILKLSEDTSYNLIAVARKSREVPALKEAIRSGATTISKARKVISVINQENQDTWLTLLAHAPARVIEKEVARVNPKAATPETVRFTSYDRLEIRLGVSETLATKLERVKDLVSQMTSTISTLEGAIDAMAETFLDRHDLVRKAKRAQSRTDKERSEPSMADPIPNAAATASYPISTESASLNHTQNKNSVTGRNLEGLNIASNNIKKVGKIHSAIDSNSCTSSTQEKSTGKRLPIHKPRRHAISAKVKHAIHLRDELRCTHISLSGERCANTRYLDLHHLRPRAHGGSDTIENLITLCRSHHRIRHQASHEAGETKTDTINKS